MNKASIIRTLTVSAFLGILFIPLSSFASGVGVYPQGAAQCQLNFTDAVGRSCYADNGHGAGIGTFQGYAYAQGDLLSGLHSKSTATFNGTSFGGNGYGGQVGAEATIADTAILHGAPSSGFLMFSFAVDGTLSLITNTGAGDYAAEFMKVGSYDSVLYFASASSPANSRFNNIETVQIPFSSTSLSLVFDLVTEAHCANGVANANSACIATSDFSNTSKIVSVDVFNGTGTLFPNATLISTSGYVYPSSVPEPDTVILLGIGLPLIVVLSRIKKFTRSC